MSRKSTIIINESDEQLQSLYNKEDNYRIRQRLKCLIYTKGNKFKGQLELSNHLGVDYATVKRWLKQYREEGVDSLASIKTGGNRKSIIDSSIHESLSEKLNNSSEPLLGYWDVVLWVKKMHGIDIKYNTLRTYLIRHFKTKLKSPRKSHYKKDEQAIIAFKKTT
jgi:transposase